MHRKHWMFISALAVAFVLSACGSSEPEAGDAEEPTTATDGGHLELHDFSYTNQDNETVSNEDLKGKYSLVNMVFTRCPTVCNLMTPNMTELQDELNERELDVNLISFTVDPEHDTPEQLKAYGEQYDADFSNWDFLTGYDRMEVENFAAASFNSVVQAHPENEDIIHSTQTFLVDMDGRVIETYDGLDVDHSPIVNDLEVLVEQEK
ncbi:SCO family protein [Geomicrobium sp. JCM 19039]|uniref:SCO family protein n=1 Tax=Geomicrobium sp. JCM 19039 TaxID=1460636 RepID=UPI00045F4B2D|nr:SCO family protein [Geomicrobium sp. JCM 19039]GAK11894.1 cytochrome oxidase biogenesis protein Sco1/SenC/PrrC, putative copper metallochaperone [Geomicrobium sp. JCM 19039]